MCIRDSTELNNNIVLGEGTEGRVYLVRDRSEALHALKQVFSVDPILDGILCREISIVQTIDHPHITSLGSAFFDGPSGTFSMTTSIRTAGDVHRYLLNKGRMEELKVQLLMHQIAKALRYLHLKRIVSFKRIASFSFNHFTVHCCCSHLTNSL